MSRADFRFHCTLRVRWAECDAQAIAYNAAYLTWTEVAQNEYWRYLGFSLYKLAELDLFDTVLAQTTIEFRAPARVDDLLEVYARVTRMGDSSLEMEYEIFQGGEEEGLTHVECIYVSYDARLGRSRLIPEEVRRLLSHFEETGERLPIEQFPMLSQASAQNGEFGGLL